MVVDITGVNLNMEVPLNFTTAKIFLTILQVLGLQVYVTKRSSCPQNVTQDLFSTTVNYTPTRKESQTYLQLQDGLGSDVGDHPL